MDWYRMIVFLHVTGVFGFLISHGASINMLLRLRQEQDPDRIRAYLDLSSASLGGLYASLLVLILAGVVAGFMGNWWGRGWIWAAILVLVVLLGVMSRLGSFYYARIRKAAGLPYMLNYKPQPAEPSPSPEEMTRLLNSAQPVWLAVLGLIGLVGLLWLMIFKPF